MTAGTLTRPRTPAPPRPPDTERRPTWQRGLLSLITVGVLAGGVWGLTVPRDAAEDGHAHGGSAVATVDLSDGTLRVDGLVDKQVGHVMPGMDMPDDVPVGMRRFGVNVSLGATEDGALTYDRRDFTVSGPGVKPVAPVAGQIDRGSLRPGSTISGSLSFDVPKESTVLSLQFRGGAAIALPALPPVAEGQHAEHGGAPEKAPGKAPAPAQAPAQAPAPAAPGADSHDAPGAAPHGH